MIDDNSSNIPHNLLIEKTILGAILLSPKNLQTIVYKVKKEFFFLESHQRIFQILLDLYKKDESLSTITINSVLGNIDFDYVLEFDEIRELASQTFVSLYIDDYILLLIDKYIRRSIINLGISLIKSAEDESLDLKTILDKAYRKISNLGSIQKNDFLVPINSIYQEIIEELNHINVQDVLIGFSSGFYNLDLLTQGFQKSDLIIIAGRPSMGKTAFSLNIASYIAKNYDKKVIIFSLEMSKKQLFFRLISSGTKIPASRLKLSRLSDHELDLVRYESQSISNIYIDDSSNISYEEILSRIKNFSTQEVGIIIIDYLQLMPSIRSSSGQNRAQELAEITRSLKNLARDLNVPIIIISQVSRNVETRIDKRPLLSDLRDSGCLSGRIFIYNKNRIPKFRLYKLFFYNNYKILSYCLNHLFCFNSFIKKTVITGFKPIYQFKIFYNSSLELTSNHLILVSRQWKKLDSIEETDQVCNFLTNLNKNTKILNTCTFLFIKYNDKFEIGPRNTFIKFSGNLKVYDLDVKLSHNFFVYNSVIHNSIEQDADLVCMLYRDSYYNLKNQENNNLTEVIITKHRNGPLGTVILCFDSIHMNFLNVS
uniref:Replicative DNA helicase n=1 Tax=Flintiella sanguinaria TaxID=101926 RepID=A0A1X9PWA7_9RHOD|nr:replication helicase subunit [Flintiella sanguinaria]